MSNSKPSAAKFIPPRLNPLLTRLIQSIFYLVARFVYQVKLEISDRDLAQLKAISQHRVVYLPNHSNLDDGLVMFLLSARVGQLFQYIVALEAFKGVIGRLMQLVGCYSIRRGMGDRSSIVQTLKILQQPGCKLVVFPEGGCSYQNDTVIPFRSGGIELSFKAMDKLTKLGQANPEVNPELYLVPLSLKYFYPVDAKAQIDKSLERLESALSVQINAQSLVETTAKNSQQNPEQNSTQSSEQNLIDPGKNFYLRLRAVSEQVLANLETEYGLKPGESENWNQRIQDLRQHALNLCETALNIAPASELPNRERIYRVQAILRSLDDQAKQNLDYAHLYRTTVRLLNFDAIYDGYVAEKPTPERFIATLDRLEREVFFLDRPKPKGLRTVEVKIATPIRLQDYQYNNDQDYSRSETISSLTQIVQKAVQLNLN